MEQAEINACFSGRYTEARELFIDAAAKSGARLEHFDHPLRGPGGEDLATDTALLGQSDAEQLLIVTSAVHGVEGFCGSACQTAMLRSGVFADAPIAVLLVHAVNPYGFAHLRRTNEDNIDINRNFVEHPHPTNNPGYAALHDLLTPGDWDGPAHLAANLDLQTRMATDGIRAVYAAASRGQYDWPEGLFYGGSEPTWSNRTWREIIARAGAGRRRIMHLDLHTGLGRYGYGEVIYVGAQNATGCAALSEWLSEPVVAIADDAAVAPPVDGPLAAAFRTATPDAELIAAALEFGTLNLPPVLRAMQADVWLNTDPDAPIHVVQSLRAEVRNAFYVDDDDWRALVAGQALRHARELVDGLCRT